MSTRTRLFASASLARLLQLIAIILLSVLRPTDVTAGPTDASIAGQVADDQGAVLPGVTVTAQSPDLAGALTTVSDAEGRYRLAAVLPGHNYTVSGELSGFGRFLRTGVDVGAGENLTLDIQLQIGGLRDSVQVIGEEVVHSRNRSERLQDVPLSISVVGGPELDRLGATGIETIAQRVANVSWNFGNQRTSSLSLRGIGKQGQTEAQDPAVGVIVDGVNYAYNALTSSFDFTDVDTVEVTRGPQGTLLGKNTSVGVIDIATKRPSFTSSADGSITLGENDTVLARLAAGGPLVDNILAWRGSFSVSKGEGDIKNLYNQDITYTNKDRASGRVQFLLIPSSKLTARVAFDLQPRGGETYNGRTFNTQTPNLWSNGTVNPLTTDPSTRLGRRWFTQEGDYSYQNDFLNGAGQDAVDNDNQRPLVTGSKGALAELTWSVGGGHTVTAISAYKDYHFNATNDDGTPFDIYRNSGGFWNDYSQITQEVRINSPKGRFVDYQIGTFFIKVNNDTDYRREWGNDAGAWFANPTQYAQLDADPAGRYLMQESLDRLSMSFNSPAGVQAIRNHSAAVFGQADWHLTKALTLTTGVRITREDRENTGSSVIKDYGDAPDLNPVAINGLALGGFASDKTGALLKGNTPAQLALADTAAGKYFGAKATGVPGAAYGSLTAGQKLEIADAKAIRLAQIGILFGPTEAEPFKADQPSYVISPSLKITHDLTTYVSLQHGEKSGIAQFTNGLSNLALPEKTTAYEWGVKSVLFKHNLQLNADLFLMNITNYQQNTRVFDAYTTNLNNDGTTYYTTATGNVPKVQSKGLEVDSIFAGIPKTTVRLSGAYEIAKYVSFPNAAQPVESGFTGAAPYRDISGQQLPGAPKLTFNVGVEYRTPIFGDDKEFHTSFNTAFTGRFNSDVALSSYAWIPASSTTDIAIGLGKRNQRVEFSFLVKNLFDDKTPILQTWNTYTPAFARWYGVVFTGKL
jgi:iron complex outermembrane recepter protein